MRPSSIARRFAFIIAATALPFGVSPLAAQGPSRAELVKRLDSIAAAPVKNHAVAGMAVAVVKGRDTLLYKGYGYSDLENDVRVTPATVFRIGSITKQFTSSAVMQLVEQGKVGLDDDATKYLPNLKTHGQHILVRNLLNHTSGIPSYTDIGAPFANVSRLDLSHDSLYALVANDSLMFAPGSHFYYNNTGYYLLGVLLERITGKPYGEYLQEKLFAPNGLKATTYCSTDKLIPHRAQGYEKTETGFVNADYIGMNLPFAAGSLCSTVGDLVAWTKKLSTGGIVNASSYHEMTTPMHLTSGRPMNYGFGLTVDSLGDHLMISHGGGINGFISYLLDVPGDSLIVAVLSNTAPAPSDAVAASLARAVLGVPAPKRATPKEQPLSADERARYTGDYDQTMPDGRKRRVTISDENGQLVLRVGSQPPARLSYQGNATFIVGTGGRLVFDVAGGRATGFVMGGGARTLEAVRVP